MRVDLVDWESESMLKFIKAKQDFIETLEIGCKEKSEYAELAAEELDPGDCYNEDGDEFDFLEPALSRLPYGTDTAFALEVLDFARVFPPAIDRYNICDRLGEGNAYFQFKLKPDF
jgi:hypothetical protein